MPANLSDREKVIACWADARCKKDRYEDSVRSVNVFGIIMSMPNYEKDCIQRLSSGWDYSEDTAWKSAANHPSVVEYWKGRE